MDLEGANALVTGGASGIGEATVRRLHDAGARVAVIDVAGASGGDVHVQADIGD
jgi:NAD(P)-dependent dehydrogenase (short-subunit alcohol dehydrogenase family)